MTDAIENTEREVLQLHIGSAGVQVGNHCWELYCLEHNLDIDGYQCSEQNSDLPPRCFFSECNIDTRKKFSSNALFIDYDSIIIDDIKTSQMRNFYNDNQFLLAKDFSHTILDRIRKQIEIYDHFQGFIISHSTSDKCSNLTSKLSSNLKSEYSNKTILTNSIFGSSINICDMSNLLEFADIIIPMENKAIFNICKHRLDIETPTYSNLNRLIATCWSNITCSMRFDGCLLSHLDEFKEILIPFPSLKLITSYLSPLIPYSYSENINFKSPSVYDMCIPSFFQSNICFINHMIPYIMTLALSLLFRSENIIPKEIGQKLICDMKKWIRFSDQTPTGFRCGINYHRPFIFNNQSDISLTDKQVLMLTNETSTSKYLCDIILNYDEKSSNHEQENIEIIEARNNIQQLKIDYEQFEKEIIDENQLDLTTPFM